jgi:hypothetical protein
MGLSFGGPNILLYTHREIIRETGNEVIKNFGGKPNFILNNYFPTSESRIHMKITKNLYKFVSVKSEL